MSPFPRPRVLIVLLASVAMISFTSFTLAQKGKGGGGTTPPPEGTIYFKYYTNTDYSMKADGSNKTLLGEWIGAPSFWDYGGYRWWIRPEVVGDGQFYPRPIGSTAEPQPRAELFAVALDEAGNQIGDRIQLTNLFPHARAGGYLRWSNRTDSFVSFLTVNFEYDEEGYRTRLFYTYDRLDISGDDLENPALIPATLDDARLWPVVALIANADINQFINCSWSPDGSVLASCRDDHIALIDAETGDERVLCSAPRDSQIGSCNWSPAGSLLLIADRPNGLQRGLYTLDTAQETPAPKTIKTGEYGSPVWSPDGIHICASRSAKSGNNDVVRLNADGSGLISLWSGLSTSGGSHYPFAWCTDRLAPALLP